MTIAAKTPMTAPAITPVFEPEEGRVLVGRAVLEDAGVAIGKVVVDEIAEVVEPSGGANDGISSSVWKANLSSCSSAFPFATEPWFCRTMVW